MYPRLVRIYGDFAIQSYGTMVVASLLVFLLATYFHPRRKELISGEAYLNGVFSAFLAGIIGGRVLYVLSFWEEFAGRPIEIFFPWTGGFVVLGSIIGVLVVMPWYLYKHRLPTMKLFDFASIFAPLMQGIARFGCLLAGCCYGCPTTAASWFSITFTDPESYLPTHLVGVPLHPAQLYAGAASLLIFLFMFFVAQRLLKKTGQLMFTYLMLECMARFLVDFWRADQGELLMVGAVQISRFQVYSGIFFVLSLVGFCVVSLWRPARAQGAVR